MFHIGFRGSLTFSVIKGLPGGGGVVVVAPAAVVVSIAGSGGGGGGGWRLIQVTCPCVTQGSLSFMNGCIG